MKSLKALSLITASLLISTGNVYGFAQSVHYDIVIDAVKYMKQNPDTTNFNQFKAAAKAAGYRGAMHAAEEIAQGAFDVDDFNDVFFCGNITGSCSGSFLGDVGENITRYISFNHFMNFAHANDEHGNDIGGYDVRYNPIPGLIDHAVEAMAYGNYMDDGKGGMTGKFGWWRPDFTEYDTYNTTEKNYRLDGYSTPEMYRRFETSPFQPIDNLGQYWYGEFLKQPTMQTLGFSLHTTDVLSPQHVWSTSDNNHGPWELWGGFFYESEDLSDSNNGYAKVTQALTQLAPLDPNSNDIRPVITQAGAFAYANGGLAMTSISHSDYKTVGKELIPYAIALVVRVLDHAAERF